MLRDEWQTRNPWLGVLPLILCLCLFLAFGALQFHLPGLHYDEAREAGLNAMELVTGQPVTAFRGATLQIGPWRTPLMVQDYIGALNVLLATPFLAIGGVNVVALRWLPLVTAALTLLATWRVALRLGGPVAGAATALLMALNPFFVFWSRQGIFVTNLTALIFVASLLTGLRWWVARRPRDLWLTAFLWGLGLYAKLLFVWAIVAMVVVAVLAWLLEARSSKLEAGRWEPSCRSQLPASSLKQQALRWTLAVVLFLIPLMPLIVFNIRTSGTLTTVFGNLGRSYYGIDNRAYLSNLLSRLRQVVTLLRGENLEYLGGVFANHLATWAALGLVGLALLVGLLARARDRKADAHAARDAAADENRARHPERSQGGDPGAVEGCGAVVRARPHPLRLRSGQASTTGRTPSTALRFAQEMQPSASRSIPVGQGARDVLLRTTGEQGSMRHHHSRWTFLLPMALLALIVLQSAITVSDLFITHYAVLVPLIPLTGGLAFGVIWEYGSGGVGGQGSKGVREQPGNLAPQLLRTLALIALLLWAGGDLWTTVRYHRALTTTGGRGPHSDAIYALAQQLDLGGLNRPVVLDWGLDAQIRFLTAGRVQPTEVFGYGMLDAPDPGFAARVGEYLENPDTIYLAHVPEHSVFRNRVNALAELAGERGLTLREQVHFNERDGSPLIVVYRAGR